MAPAEEKALKESVNSTKNNLQSEVVVLHLCFCSLIKQRCGLSALFCQAKCLISKQMDEQTPENSLERYKA